MQLLKSYFLAILTGLFCGLITIPYRYVLEKSIYIRKLFFSQTNAIWIHIGTFLCFYLVMFFLKKIVEIAPFITGSGIPQVKGEIYGRYYLKNPLKNMWLKFIGGITGITMGFSLGREGPSVQIGSFIGEKISSFFKVNEVERKYLIISGAAAGLSSAFTAPLASSIFIAEELEKYYNPRLIIFSFLGAITSGYMASKVFITNDYLKISRVFPKHLADINYILILILFGIFISLIGKFFVFLTLYFQKKYKKNAIPTYLKLFLMTLMVYLMGFFFVDLTSGGEEFLITQGIEGSRSILMILFFLVVKLLFSTISYSTGFPGGIFLPLLVIGGLSGKFFALVMSYFNFISWENIGFFIFLGMAAVFVVVVRSPATGIILILEMTWDFSLLPSMVITCAFAYTLSYLMKSEPIYDSLYKVLITQEENLGRTELFYEVGEESYFKNKKIDEITLWKNVEISSIKRDKIKINLEDSVVRERDVIGITVDRKDIEKYYDALRALSKEN